MAVRYSDEMKRKVLELYYEHKSVNKVNKLTGVQRNTISSWIKNDKERKEKEKPEIYKQPILIAVNDAMRELADTEKKLNGKTEKIIKGLSSEKESLALSAIDILKKRLALINTLSVREGIELMSNRDLISVVKETTPQTGKEEESEEVSDSIFDAYTSIGIHDDN